MRTGYCLVRYLADGHIAERKEHIAERLLKKGLVEIIEKPTARVLKSPLGREEDRKPVPAEKPPAGGSESGSASTSGVRAKAAGTAPRTRPANRKPGNGRGR